MQIGIVDLVSNCCEEKNRKRSTNYTRKKSSAEYEYKNNKDDGNLRVSFHKQIEKVRSAFSAALFFLIGFLTTLYSITKANGLINCKYHDIHDFFL